MPAAKKPPAAPKAPEVKAQKPEIRLTPSAIAGHRAGQKAPLEQLTKDHFAKTQRKKASRRRRTKIGRRVASRRPKSWPRRRSAARASKRRRADGTEEEVDGKMAGMAAARLDRQKSRKVRARARTETPEGEEEREAAPRPTAEDAGPPARCQHRRPAPGERRPGAALHGPQFLRGDRRRLGAGAQVAHGDGHRHLEYQRPAGQRDRAFAGHRIGSPSRVQAAADPGRACRSRNWKRRTRIRNCCRRGRRSSRSWGTSTTARRRCWTHIIGTNVVAGEAGGITQHIRAYRITKNGRPSPLWIRRATKRLRKCVPAVPT